MTPLFVDPLRSAADDALGALIAPVDSDVFFADSFERDVLHVARDDANYFRWLYGVTCVENALTVGADNPETFALHKHGAPDLARDAFTSERAAVRPRGGRPARSIVDPRRVLAAFADGYTLTIKDAGALHPPLGRVCNRIAAERDVHVHANAYFTPPGSQGFATHYDTHGTLIAQITGSKDWCVYAPIVTLPTERQPYEPGLHDGKLGTPRQIRLDAGDSLYIPHGFPHHATASHERSLHLTFAIAPLRMIDVLDALVQLAARDEPELRRALPPGWHRDPTFAAHVHDRLAAILPRAIDRTRVQVAAERAFNDFFAATRTTADGTFDTLAAFEHLRPASRLRIRDDTPFALRERADRLDIVLAAQVVSTPVSAQAAFARLASGPAHFAEIEAALPPDDAREFVRTLVLAGLISIENDASALGARP